MENNDYLKDIIPDEQERQAIYKKGEEREAEWEQRYEDAILKGKINRRQSNINALRYIATGLTVAFLGASFIGLSINAAKKNTKESEINTMINEDENTITLTRNYTVSWGDTITAISNRTGISQRDITSDNDIENANRIGEGQHLVLNYSIDSDNLKYYTETVSVEGKYISEIASEYDTTIKTIYDLNKDAIIDNGNGTYTIISDTVLVPKWITPTELKEAQAKGK